MTLDYFYGAQADQFAFYRIPKALFTDERFKSISAEAKILYGILLDRMSLSRKNGWLDEQGRVFIIFTLEEVMEAIGCADQKATKLLNELDSKAGLIERKRQGLGKPNLIFVKNFVDNSDGSIPPAPESRIKTRENHDSADVNFTTPESRKSRGSNTDSNYTDLSETEAYPFPSGQAGGHGQAPVDKMGRDMDEREQYRAILEENLEYDILLENNPYDQDTIAEIMELLLDTICSKRQYIRIAGDDKPREVVKSQFLKLNSTHIEYVLSSFKENASKVRNIKQYLLASLYNAPLTISNYYDALVRHDMANGFVWAAAFPLRLLSFPGGDANWQKKRTRQLRQSGLPVRQAGEKSRKRNTRPGPLPRTKTPAARHRKFWNRRAQSRNRNGRLRNRSYCSRWTDSGRSKTTRSK